MLHDHSNPNGDADLRSEAYDVRSDEDLMLDLKRGDGDAFAVLFDRYNRLVLTVALRIIRDAGHKNMENHDDGPRVLAQTRQYILDFQELAEKTTTANELYDQMLARYPEWLSRGALWSSAIAIRK